MSAPALAEVGLDALWVAVESDAAGLARAVRASGRPAAFDGAGPVLERHRDGTPQLIGLASPADDAWGLQLAGEGWRILDARDDERLPGHRLLQDAVALEDIVRSALGRGAIEGRRVVRYRPGRRAVVRVETVGAEGGAIWLKLFTKTGFRRASAAVRWLAETPGLPVLLPLAEVESMACMVFGQARGVAINESGTRRLGTVADALCSFWQASAADPDGEDLSGEEIARQTAKMLERGAELRPYLRDLAHRIGSMDLPDLGPVGLVHGDLHDKQIFVDGSAVTLIDCDGVRRGPTAFDAVNLAEHLDLRHAQHGSFDTAEGDAFLRSVGVSPTDDATRALRALVRARLAGVYACRPRSWGLSDRLAEQALQAAESVG